MTFNSRHALMPGDFPQRPFFFRWEKPGFLLMDLKKEGSGNYITALLGFAPPGGKTTSRSNFPTKSSFSAVS